MRRLSSREVRSLLLASLVTGTTLLFVACSSRSRSVPDPEAVSTQAAAQTAGTAGDASVLTPTDAAPLPLLDGPVFVDYDAFGLPQPPLPSLGDGAGPHPLM